ncbi:hypothetical protein AY600_00780 [Phormidium willei BDU 130791]|nr:hypothetical protein AY600_00780 [Phormidium willei BDU 130791]
MACRVDLAAVWRPGGHVLVLDAGRLDQRLPAVHVQPDFVLGPVDRLGGGQQLAHVDRLGLGVGELLQPVVRADVVGVGHVETELRDAQAQSLQVAEIVEMVALPVDGHGDVDRLHAAALPWPAGSQVIFGP